MLGLLLLPLPVLPLPLLPLLPVCLLPLPLLPLPLLPLLALLLMPSSAAAGETTGGWCTAGSYRATGGDPAVLRAPVVGPAPGVSSALPSSAPG